MRLSIFTFVFVVGLFFLLPSAVQACSCVGAGQPCQAFWNAETVFSGEVEKISDVSVDVSNSEDRKMIFQQKSVRFAVGEKFRGISEDSVEIITGRGGGDCGYKFEVGQSYLVYAYKNAKTGKLGTGICTRTRLLSKAIEDLEYFRSLPNAESGSTISGKVLKRFVRKDDDPYKEPAPLANIPIILEGESAVLETNTDEKGEYRLTGLMPGEYKIRLKVPKGLWGYEEGNKVKVFDKGCVFSYFVLETKTEVSGRLYDENSLPASEISVNLVPVDQIGSRYQKNNIFAFTEKDGRFTFRSIPAGTYYLGIRLDRLGEPTFPYPRTFYLGTTDIKSAKTITISEGQVFQNYDFGLPRKLSPRKIEGIVVYPDGSPVPNASISVKETEYAEGSMGYVLGQTKPDGTFSFSVMDGLRYLLKPVVSTANPSPQQKHAEPIEIPAKGDVKNLKFVITEPNGNCEKCLRWTRKKDNSSEKGSNR